MHSCLKSSHTPQTNPQKESGQHSGSRFLSFYLVIAVVCVARILAGILRAGILGAVRRILAGIVGIVCIVGVVCIAAVVCIVCHNFVSS